MTTSPRGRGGSLVVTLAVFAAAIIGCGSDESEKLPPDSPPGRVLMVGDSIAFQTAQGMGRVQRNHHLRASNGGVPGCGVVRAQQAFRDGDWMPVARICNAWAARWQSQVARADPEVALLLSGFWDVLDIRLVDGRELEFGSDESDEYIEAELNAAIDILSAGGAKVLLLTTPYFAPPQDGGEPENAQDPARVDHINEIFRGVADGRRDVVEVLDLNDWLTPDGYRDSVDSRLVRADGIHLTPAGQRYVADWLAPELADAIAEQREDEPPAP